MRLLFSLILFCFFLTTAMESYADGLSTRRLIDNKSPETEIIGFSLGDNNALISTHTNIANSFSARYRSFSSINFINDVCFFNSAVIINEKKHFVHPNFYCKSMGLKLLFPKHYFW